MGWFMFLLGMMAGGMVGAGAMCLIFYAREPGIFPEIPREMSIGWGKSSCPQAKITAINKDDA